MSYFRSNLGLFSKLWISFFLLLAFLANAIGPAPEAQAYEFILPQPGRMVHLSPEFNPPILKGIKVHPEDPFRFDFILDQGDYKSSVETPFRASHDRDAINRVSTRLIKYFLASLTVPEKDLWVNLSPYEKDRIIPESFGLTEMGRDLLAEDYMLKQITASLIYPEDNVGKKFWNRIYEEAENKYGTTNIPVNTFNKVWIVPQKALVYENSKAATAYIIESKLKVMLEEDYLSLTKHEGVESKLKQNHETSQLGSQIVREIVIPQLTKEVNENKNFATLRQAYNSLILAAWYKKKIKDSILSSIYEDKNKVIGININDPKEKQKIYERYLQAFKRGVFNYIKEELDPMTQEEMPRKYFSGGIVGVLDSMAMITTTAMNNLPQEGGALASEKVITVKLRVPVLEIKKRISSNINFAMNTGDKPGDDEEWVVATNPIVEKYKQKLNFNASYYEEYVKNLKKKERVEFERRFMQDFVQAVKDYERSGEWQYYHPEGSANVRNNFITPGKPLFGEKNDPEMGKVGKRGFFESEKFFFDRLVRPYLHVTLEFGGPSGKKVGEPVAAYLKRNSKYKGDVRAWLKAQALFKDAARQVFNKFAGGDVNVKEYHVNPLYRWGFKILKNFSAVIAERITIWALGLIASLVTALVTKKLWIFPVGFLIYAPIAELFKRTWDWIGSFFFDELNAKIEKRERRYYDTLIKNYVMEIPPAKETEAEYRIYCDEMRDYLKTVDQKNDFEGQKNQKLFKETERIVLKGLKQSRQYLWVAKIGKELTESGVPVDTYTVVLSMLKELSDENPKYFDKLVRRWQWQKKWKDRIVNVLGIDQRQFLPDIFLEMEALFRLQKNEKFLYAKAEERAKEMHLRKSTEHPQVDGYTYESHFQVALEELLTTKRFKFDGMFVKYFLGQVSTSVKESKHRRSLILSYFLAGGGARLRRIQENLNKGKIFRPTDSKRVIKVTQAHLIPGLGKIKTKANIDYGISAEEIGHIEGKLNAYISSPEVQKIIQAGSPAMINSLRNEGGIDFQKDKLNLEIQSLGDSIKFKLDPAMLNRLEHVPGFTPVIINIQPLRNLRQFLLT